MNPVSDALANDDPRLLRAVQQYLADLEAGRHPDRQTVADHFPDLAEAMGPYLDALDLIHAAVPTTEAAVPDQANGEASAAEPLGDFRILREIGRGGMGVVHEAVQLSLGRRVALKVLPFAATLDARQLRRFKNEAQAAAQLHHTNIVPVYAVGAERGVHFYAMQLIEGKNLATLIEELRQASGRGKEGAKGRPAGGSTVSLLLRSGCVHGETTDTPAGPRARHSTHRSGRTAEFFRAAARLAAQAAEALDYAHGLGIVHRDIKPANLLLDDRGNAWITDFGLAQFHDAGLTQTGEMVGTLRYMSPEQAAGQRVLLDHRTDVYSLGATLYELLTLWPIFDGTDRRTLLHQILNEEPRPLRALDRSVPPELEIIVLKATAKAPTDRYASAAAFADDLHRFLRDEPIRARRATLAQRGRKWLRRHPWVPAVVAALLVLLAAGSLLSAWLIRGEQANTQRAYDQERQRAQEAETRFRLAKRSVDEMIQISNEELADQPHLEGLRWRLLESALVYYQEFIAQRRDDPAAQEELREEKARVEQMLADLAVLHGDRQLSLLGESAVLDDLGLNAEQRTKVKGLAHRLDRQRAESFRDFGRLEPDERRQRFLDLARSNDAEVRQILSRAELRRLRQIALQLKGPSAFGEPDVSLALKLSASQKERIRAIEWELLTAKGTGFPHGRPGRPEKTRRLAALEQIQALLTEEQHQRWREMTGSPFQGPNPFAPPPGPSRPSGPSGPRGPLGSKGPPR